MNVDDIPQRRATDRPILVVDDDPGIREVLEHLIKVEGHETISAVDGLDALDKIDQVLPALIVLDIAMPRLDGYGVIAELERRGVREQIRILLISAAHLTTNHARVARAESYFAKPFEVDELLNEVHRLLA